MTIATETRRAGPYSGNGSTQVFAFNFKCYAAADLVVVTTTSGVDTVKTLTTHYTVSLNANQNTNPGGSITMLTAPATGTTLVITTDQSYLQETSFVNAGAWLPEAVNDALDKQTILHQQNRYDIDRSLRGAISDSAWDRLPAASLRAGGLLGFDDATGQPMIADFGAVEALAADINTVASIAAEIEIVAAADVDIATVADNIDAVNEVSDWIGGGGEAGDIEVTSTGSTTARSLADRFGERVSVLDWGATPTAATVQAALNACTGRVLYFPAGTYALASPVAGDGEQVVEYETGVSFTGNTPTGVTSFAYHTGTTYSFRGRKSVSAPTTLESLWFTFCSATGNNTDFIGATTGYHVVADNSDVTASNKPALVGVAYSMRPKVARDLIGIDDVAGILIQNDTEFAGAMGTDAIYVGKNGAGSFTDYQFEWTTGATIAGSCGYPFRVSSASYFCGFNISGKMIGASTNGFGVLIDTVIYDTVTNRAAMFRSEPDTFAASFTLSELFHFSAAQGTIGAGSAVTTQVGFNVSNSLTGATNNYGFRGQLASASGRWNLYMDGTAGNYVAGEVLISSAATSVTPSSAVSPRLQVTGGTAATSSALIGRFDNSANGPALTFAKSRNTTVGGDTVVQSGDILGTVRFDGNDGAAEILGASISAVVDGTPGTNDMPGRLVFSTTADGASTVTERMRLASNGDVVFGNNSIANAATAGFIWLPSTTSGAPSGTPAGSYTGRVPMVVDETNSRLYIRLGGTWKSVALA